MVEVNLVWNVALDSCEVLSPIFGLPSVVAITLDSVIGKILELEASPTFNDRLDREVTEAACYFVLEVTVVTTADSNLDLNTITLVCDDCGKCGD